MGLNDLLLGPAFFILLWVVALRLRSRYYGNSVHKKYFIPGMMAKMVGTLSLGLIYQFYYRGEGDSFGYFSGAKSFVNYFVDSPVNAIKFLFTTNEEYFLEFLEYVDLRYLYLFMGDAELIVTKITGVFSIFTLNSYLGTAFLFAFLSFTGAWALYRVFTYEFPHLHKQLAIAALFVPSVFFWGSGILKDCVTFGALGWFTYAAYFLLVRRRKIFFSLIMLILNGWLIMEVKGYILLGFLPALIFWVVNIHKRRIHSSFLRKLITPIMLVGTIVLGFMLITQVGGALGRYSIQNITEVAEDFHVWHSIASEGGSGYNLGEISYSPAGMLSKLPAALNVTLFRPYLWEIGSIIILPSAIESLLIFFLTLSTLWVVRPLMFFKIIFGNPTLTFCFIFVIIFGFAVGFTSYNFGALVRYKIPCIPFYVAMVYMVKDIWLKKKMAREGRELLRKEKAFPSLT